LGPRCSVDFTITGYHLVGRKTKYGYFLGSDDDDDQLPTGHFKIDLEKSGKDSVVGQILYGDGAIGGHAPSLDPNADEDGGYLIVFTNTEQKNGQPAASEL
jgi:hypothetical protein